MPAPENPSDKRLSPAISTVLGPILSARRPAMPLVIAAIAIITENRLPASTAERENDCLISGRAMPSVATIIEGIRLLHGAMQTVKSSRRDAAGEAILRNLFLTSEESSRRCAADFRRRA